MLLQSAKLEKRTNNPVQLQDLVSAEIQVQFIAAYEILVNPVLICKTTNGFKINQESRPVCELALEFATQLLFIADSSSYFFLSCVADVSILWHYILPYILRKFCQSDGKFLGIPEVSFFHFVICGNKMLKDNN